MKRPFLLLLLWPVLSGCATRVPGSGGTWPDPQRREWVLPPGPRVDWPRGLSLGALLDAVESSPEMQARLYDLEIEGKRRRAISEMGRTSGLGILGARESRSDRTSIGAGVEQVFDVGRNGRWRREVGEMDADESAHRALEVLRVARVGAERAYWRAVAAEERLKAWQPAVASREGLISEPRGVSLPLEEDRTATRAELERLCGGFAPPGWRLLDKFPADHRHASLQHARDFARSSRPEMAADAAAVEGAAARVRLAESASSTDIGVGVQYQVEKYDNAARGLQSGIIERKTFAGASFSFPGHPPDRLAEAESARRGSLRALSETESGILREVDEAFRRHEETLNMLEKVEQSRRVDALARIDAEADWAVARCELEGVVGRPVDEFSR